MSAEEGLFPEPERIPLEKGDRVSLDTMWGREGATVMRTGVDADGWPFVQLRMDAGDTVTINVARVSREVPA